MSKDSRRRVGIMGGTFDPIHIGHLILGENAYQQFGLDCVLFMPSGNPPHKKERNGRASTQERIDMVALAIADNPHFVLSLEETHENGYTYTRETLARLTRENPDTDYYFIMGADSLFAFESWKEPQGICDLCTILVAVRNDVRTKDMDSQIAYLTENTTDKYKNWIRPTSKFLPKLSGSISASGVPLDIICQAMWQNIFILIIFTAHKCAYLCISHAKYFRMDDIRPYAKALGGKIWGATI